MAADAGIAQTEMLARGDIDFSIDFATALDHSDRRRRADQGDLRRACRLLRAVRTRRHQEHRGPQGPQGRRRRQSVIGSAYLRQRHGDLCRPRSATRHRMDRRRGKAGGAFRRGQGRCLPGLSAGGSGPARPQSRPRHPRQRQGPAVVAILLLHAGGQRRLCRETSGCHQARRPRHPQIRRHLRGRAGAGGAPSGGWRTHRTIRLRRAVAPRAPILQLARLRSRGHDEVLLAAAA